MYDIMVEIRDDQGRDLQARLLAGAYRGSRRREVAVVLGGVGRDTVDRLLDPVVQEVGTGVRGVRYLDRKEAARLLGSLRNGDGPDLVIVSPDASWADGWAGASRVVRSPEDGLERLEEEPDRPVEGSGGPGEGVPSAAAASA